jgi:hypothetical protein
MHQTGAVAFIMGLLSALVVLDGALMLRGAATTSRAISRRTACTSCAA